MVTVPTFYLMANITFSKTQVTAGKVGLHAFAGLQIIFSPERTYVLLRHHLGQTKQNCGRMSPT